MIFTFNSNNLYNYPITHISFDRVDIEKKVFYGVAHYLDWANMKDLGRIVANGTDDEFEKAYQMYQRGVNMFEVFGNQIIIS